jgi:hypothetical protein
MAVGSKMEACLVTCAGSPTYFGKLEKIPARERQGAPVQPVLK